ncbi:DUF2177 family protein [Phenylobacterium sp.]|uniref:DUF2177 family protein n=1 Tax=Phenylobacterium sp. TaxID=1871053 RepID=UPI0027311DD5|nr:DUF2177 family protein [Phenylobacterium sp.]MDP1600807.1 DUF2177 family protein [Phenylobacterium sp.]MDP3593343.1 DUF2177 family protein [Phenylobacterium sp.]
MLKYLAAYLGAGLAFAVIDAVWLTTVGPKLYRPALDDVLADQFNLPAAIAFYLVFIAGVLMLAILPAVREGAGWTRAMANGAMLGFVAYATYDLTNQATLKVWSLKVTLADIGWGTVLTACAAAAGFAAYRWTETRLG